MYYYLRVFLSEVKLIYVPPPTHTLAVTTTEKPSPPLQTASTPIEANFDLITQLGTVLHPLSKEILYAIMDTDNTVKGNLLERHLTPEIYDKVLALPRLSTILKALWLVKVAYPSLEMYNDEQLASFKENNNFLTFVTFTDKNDRETVERFQDRGVLGAVLDYVSVYKRMRENTATTSSPQSQLSGTGDSGAVSTLPSSTDGSDAVASPSGEGGAYTASKNVSGRLDSENKADPEEGEVDEKFLEGNTEK